MHDDRDAETPALATVPRAAEAPFARVLHFGGGHDVEIAAGALVAAAVLHLGVMLGLAAKPVETQAQQEIVEVDVSEKKEEKKEEPPPPPPPPGVEEKPTPEPTNPNAKEEPTKEPPPPELGKAGHLLTADDKQSDKDDEPTSFAEDPNGNRYGSGLVGRGGTADHGAPGASTVGVPGGTGTGVPKAGPVISAGPPPPLTEADLSKRVGIPADPCRGYFPNDADDDEGYASVLLSVAADGKVVSATVVSEEPKGQGFGRQARVCFNGRRLEPALDKSGKAVQFSQTIRVHFRRS
jgi:type IV secretory pathway VirB10-like protein